MFVLLYISKQAGTVSVNDFHQVLQDVTNFPLRPFVLPFLKANIPLLSREIAALAAITNHTPIQYLRTHQHLLIESSRSTNATSSSGKKNVFNNMYVHSILVSQNRCKGSNKTYIQQELPIFTSQTTFSIPHHQIGKMKCPLTQRMVKRGLVPVQHREWKGVVAFLAYPMTIWELVTSERRVIMEG